MKRNKVRGFTLVEVIVVVAIVGILSSIALPSYTSYVARARRADAQAQLTQAAQLMQRYYSANDRYDQDRSGTTNAVSHARWNGLRQSPADGAAVYNLSLASVGTDSFTLKMAPATGTSMAQDKCGTFTLTNTGVRGVEVGGTAGSTELRDQCWNGRDPK
jgi:type IV pilus assembly protein PilE